MTLDTWFAGIVLVIAVALTTALSGGTPAAAADQAMHIPSSAMRSGSPAGADNGLPFPRSWRAQAVWSEQACWKGCQSYCTAALDDCLTRSPDQSVCVAGTGRCERICQNDCRAYGGPLLVPLPR